MVIRRTTLAGAVAAAVAPICVSSAFASGIRILLVHGRSQQGRKAREIQDEWLGALREGVEKNATSLPPDLQIELPFYGDRLDEFARMSKVPLTSEIKTRGGPETDEFLQFQAEVAEEIRIGKGITEEQINVEYGDNPKQRGPLNWDWVQAIITAIDKHGGGLSGSALEVVTRDVFLYVNYPAVRDEIDAIVRASLDERPTLVIAHSLGTVVAYSILQTDERPLDVRLITLGSPLSIRAIRRRFTPISFPPHVASWRNAYDTRDVVALYPLDKDNFDVTPSIENFGKVRNKTDNRHGIVGYLDDQTVAGWILSEL